MSNLADDHRTENLSDDAENDQDSVKRWITFRLDKEAYAIDVIQVREILRVFNVLPVPGAPKHVLGITNIRGSVVTVVDGRACFNLPAQQRNENTRLIVLESGDEVAGVVVDSVSDVLDLPVSAIDTNPRLNARESSKYIKGVVNDANGLIIILSIDKFFTGD